MSIRTILFAASGGSATRGAAELACQLARRFEAHVEGYHVRADPRGSEIALGPSFGVPVGGELMERLAEEITETAARAKQHFNAAVAAYNLPIRCEPPMLKQGAALALKATATWREEIGFAGTLIPSRARLFDLVLLGRSERVVDRPHSDVIEETLLKSGRPVLVSPDYTDREIGTNVAIAWNGSAEAARAVAGAMPFIRAAKSVQVLTGGDTDGAEGIMLTQALAWHGIGATDMQCPRARGATIGQQLLTTAQEQGADLLVMGGYGKAPWREMLLGGATRQVIGSSLMPILIAH